MCLYRHSLSSIGAVVVVVVVGCTDLFGSNSAVVEVRGVHRHASSSDGAVVWWGAGCTDRRMSNGAVSVVVVVWWWWWAEKSHGTSKLEEVVCVQLASCTALLTVAAKLLHISDA